MTQQYLHFTFEPRTLNATGKWYVQPVTPRRDVVEADVFNRELMIATHLDRSDIQAVMVAVRNLLLDELARGNSVNLFDLVRLTPSFTVEAPCVTSAANARAVAVGLKAADIKARVNACPTLRLSRSLMHVLHGRITTD